MMINLDRGIQTVEIPLTKHMFERLYQLTETNDEMAMKRKLSYQYRGAPRFDPRDILSIDWQEASARLKEFDYPVLAVLEVRRGHLVLSEFLIRHADIHVERGHDCYHVFCDQHEDCEVVELRHDSLASLHVSPPEPPPRAKELSEYTEEHF